MSSSRHLVISQDRNEIFALSSCARRYLEYLRGTSGNEDCFLKLPESGLWYIETAGFMKQLFPRNYISYLPPNEHGLRERSGNCREISNSTSSVCPRPLKIFP